MTFRVVTYIRIEPDEEILYNTMEEAEVDVENLRLMQPWDIHVIEEVPAVENSQSKTSSTRSLTDND